MAKSSSLEIDFFNMEKEKIPSKPAPSFQRRKSFRDIQGAISKINPEILKSVIGNHVSSVPSTPKENCKTLPLPSLPVLCDPTLRLSCGSEKDAPLTIFYNGMVSVYHVSPHKAQDILKFAQEQIPKSANESNEHNSYDKENLLETLNGELPITRKKSLQRFLEKRKERFV
ncbi:hypothetical protein ACJIZ3_004639 [Penstemon smallii]|uniref:Protein TIFY n=1 Tax=Penstemon smallii TaxID=265156 RepID=A0ABD3S2M3_9LAMI